MENVTKEELMNSKKLYAYLLESIDTAIEKDIPVDDVIDEGILSGLIGAAAGATIGPAITKAVCSALGITKGPLYDLVTSRLITTSVGAILGY